MDARLIYRIETGTAHGASALLAGSVGFAAYTVLAAAGIATPIGLAAAGAGALAYLPCSRLLASRRDRGFALSDFAPRPFEFSDLPEELLLTDRVEPDELLLTERLGDADELLLTERLGNADELLLTERLDDAGELLLTDADRVDSPLLLDDILAEMGPQSRVVRLFDRKAMASPSPGELQARIAHHLDDGAARTAPSDASQALSAALAELRRSLR